MINHIINTCFIHHVIIVFLLLLSSVLSAWLFILDGRKREWKMYARRLQKPEPWIKPMDTDK